MKRRILWIDDEISGLKSLILLLKEHGYEVEGISNGEDGCERLKEEIFDLILLDEIMPGKDGLQTLREIRTISPSIPVVMLTKSEEEAMIDKAYMGGANDFLTKPLKPQQLISTCKRLFEREKLIRMEYPENYTKFYQSTNQKIATGMDWRGWGKVYLELMQWGVKIADSPEISALHTQLVQSSEHEFAKFVESNYRDWINDPGGPTLSVGVVPNFVIPWTRQAQPPSEPIYFVILDCLKFDQWWVIRPFLEEFYKIKEDFYFSILPSATPFARNAIYSGLYPSEICKQYPAFWAPEENKHEKELFDLQLQHFGIHGAYIKVLNLAEELSLIKNVRKFKYVQLISIVINFLDYLVHAKRGSQVLEELAPDEFGLRALTELWFSRSKLYELLKVISQEGNPVILTTDHGSILAKRPTTVYGSGAISRNLRYKYGPSLRCDPRHTIYIENPADYKLPNNVRYGIAKEDYYFIYPTHPHQYTKEYKYTFQHGGVSMQEMILPCITLLPK